MILCPINSDRGDCLWRVDFWLSELCHSSKKTSERRVGLCPVTVPPPRKLTASTTSEKVEVEHRGFSKWLTTISRSSVLGYLLSLLVQSPNTPVRTSITYSEGRHTISGLEPVLREGVVFPRPLCQVITWVLSSLFESRSARGRKWRCPGNVNDRRGRTRKRRSRDRSGKSSF